MRLRRYRYVIYAVVLLIILLALFDRTTEQAPTVTPMPPDTPAPTIAPAPPDTPAPTIAPAPSPSPTPYVKPIPKKLFFPKYDIESHIFPVGITKSGNVGTVNSALDTAWFSPYAAPGEDGNAILNGHVRWKKVAGHFAKLMDMEIGDEVFIQFEDESVKYFAITNIEYAGLDAFPPEALEKGGAPRMTLITCKGDFDRSIGTSRTRVVAVCKEKEAPNAPFSPPPLLPPEKTPTLGK